MEAADVTQAGNATRSADARRRRESPRTPPERATLPFVADYPAPGTSLFANVRTITGWWGDGTQKPTSVSLSIDGLHVDAGRLGYPRLDALEHGIPMEAALELGFRLEFDPAGLEVGEHEFEFRGSFGDRERSRIVRARYEGPEAPLHVADVFIDVVGFCNLRCRMCPHGGLEGLKGQRPGDVMPPEVLDRVLGHLRAAGCLTGVVNLYNWGDPLLHPQLAELLAVCAAHGQRVILSSNLSMSPRSLEPLRNGGVALLMVSISGVTREVYSRNHQGGRIDRVIENLRIVSAEREEIESILLKYLVFDYNRHEIGAARDLAVELGIEFGAYRGTVPSLESHLLKAENGIYAEQADGYVSGASRQQVTGKACPQESNIIVDPRGNLDACAMSWQHRYGASAASADMRRYLLQKMNNPTCANCQATGYSHHRHYGIIDPDVLRLTFS